MVSEFDFESSEAMGLLKFDFLTLRTLDTIEVCLGLIHTKYGETINFYDWNLEYKDPEVWEVIPVATPWACSKWKLVV